MDTTTWKFFHLALLLFAHSNKIIGDAEYRFAAEFQAKEMFGRKALADKKTNEVCVLSEHVHNSRYVYNVSNVMIYTYQYITILQYFFGEVLIQF